MPQLHLNASGGIFDKPTLLGGNNVVGEAGSEAIIPLSNKSKVAPFANAVASSFMSMLPDNFTDKKNDSTELTVVFNNPVIKEEADIEKISEKLYKLQERNRRGRGGNV